MKALTDLMKTPGMWIWDLHYSQFIAPSDITLP
uniref:Uncharacterized protein n=1 Tax=Anguilla anguilla TaxID=7936 RepID=A0A0E9XHM8_ANGAN